MYEYISEQPPESPAASRRATCAHVTAQECLSALPDAACREAAVNQRWYSVNYALCSQERRAVVVFTGFPAESDEDMAFRRDEFYGCNRGEMEA